MNDKSQNTRNDDRDNKQAIADFAERLRWMLSDMGIRQNVFAERLDVPNNTLNRIINAQVQSLQIEIMRPLAMISEAAGYNVRWLFAGLGNPKTGHTSQDTSAKPLPSCKHNLIAYNKLPADREGLVPVFIRAERTEITDTPYPSWAEFYAQYHDRQPADIAVYAHGAEPAIPNGTLVRGVAATIESLYGQLAILLTVQLDGHVHALLRIPNKHGDKYTLSHSSGNGPVEYIASQNLLAGFYIL